jgi:hypothetical protein
MSRARNVHHQSHQPARRPARWPGRTLEAIAARNRAWRDLAPILGLPQRYTDKEGNRA